MQAFVPVDDKHTMFHFVASAARRPDRREMRAAREKRSAMRMGLDLDTEYRKSRTRANSWLQDRAAMRAGNFTGIEGVNNEDIAMQESMGAIYDRTKEHLGASDMAVIRMRRIMLDGVRKFTEGAPPVGLAEPVAYETLARRRAHDPQGDRLARHSRPLVTFAARRNKSALPPGMPSG